MNQAWSLLFMFFISPATLKIVEFAFNRSSINYAEQVISEHTRFLIFEVHPNEGYSIKRTAYIRAATLVKYLNERGEDWVLVVPEWYSVFHRKTKSVVQLKIPWGQYFDLRNMNLYVPVMEFSNFWNNIGSKTGIEHVIVLQYEPTSKTKERFSANDRNYFSYDECNHPLRYRKDNQGFLRGDFFGRGNEIFGKNYSCVLFQGKALVLADMLKDLPERVIMIDQFELVNPTYIPQDGEVKDNENDMARRSLVFAKHLRQEGDMFRATFLNSTDKADKTTYNDEDWRLQVAEHGSAKGGPYISVHMRRNDWLSVHAEEYYSITELADELSKRLKEYGLKKVYLATDGTAQEIAELQSRLQHAKIYRYPNNLETVKKFSEIGIAIIDQWIAAHARYFIGTYKSGFSKGIHHERDILGFSLQSNYNTLCNKNVPADKCTYRFSRRYLKHMNDKHAVRLEEMQKIIRSTGQDQKHIEL